MNSSIYTPRQLRALQAAPVNARLAMAREFRAQNSGRNILAYRGNGNTRRRARNNINALANNNGPRLYNNTNSLRNVPAVTRQNSSLVSPPPSTNTPSFQATIVMSPVEVQSAFAVTTLPVHPNNIPSLQPYVAIYGEWTFISIQFRFVSTAPSTAGGSVGLCISENNQATPTRMSQLTRQPNIVLSRVYDNSNWAAVPIYKRDTWYSTQGTDNQQSYNRNPGWLIVGATSTMTGQIGYIECRYNVKFRLPRRFPHVATNSTRHYDEDNDEDKLTEYEFPCPLLEQKLPPQVELQQEESEVSSLKLDVSGSGSK